MSRAALHRQTLDLKEYASLVGLVSKIKIVTNATCAGYILSFKEVTEREMVKTSI